jgi:hypothetical protein
MPPNVHEASLQAIVDHEHTHPGFIAQNMSRSDLLPIFFRIKGKPFTINDRPQFKELFSDSYVPDTIFMTARQIGKSISLSRSEVLDCRQIPHFQVLYVAPLQKQTQRYSTVCLHEATHSANQVEFMAPVEDQPGAEIDANIVTSVSHQTFSNGSGIQLTYAKTSPDRTRGISADRIDFDEVQDQLVDNIPIIAEALTDSAWGLRRFTGTAKTTDNVIEAFWQQSAQCEWVVKCGSCNYFNIPTIDGHVLDMIQAPGPVCIKCGRLLDVRQGEFVPAYPERMSSFRGFHIPQIVVPAITENRQKWDRLFAKVMRQDLATTLQENLGISCSEGQRLLTAEDIRRQSTLPTTKVLQTRLSDYVMTIGGLDWGVAEQTSFTVHTIIGIRPDGAIHVLYARRFIGFNPDDVMQTIHQAHAFYGCRILCADYGMGFDKNVILEHRFGLPVIQIMYTRQAQLMNSNPSMGHPRYTVDRTTAIELVFMAIKYGKIRFPPQIEFQTYTDDILAIYEEVTESDIERRYFARNPNHSDDFAHALTFACLGAMRLMGTTILDVVPEIKVTRSGPPPIIHTDGKIAEG